MTSNYCFRSLLTQNEELRFDSSMMKHTALQKKEIPLTGILIKSSSMISPLLVLACQFVLFMHSAVNGKARYKGNAAAGIRQTGRTHSLTCECLNLLKYTLKSQFIAEDYLGEVPVSVTIICYSEYKNGRYQIQWIAHFTHAIALKICFLHLFNYVSVTHLLKNEV